MIPDPYHQIHVALRREKGRARDLQCVACGEPAIDWAYQHTGETLICERRNSPYSMNLDDYAPMCRGCHQHLDNQQRDPDTPKVRIKTRRKCLDCSLVTTPAAMSSHLRTSQHNGFSDATPLPSP